MSDPLAADADRLALAAGLTQEAARAAGEDSGLVAAERALTGVTHRGTHFNPPYPGVRVREDEDRIVLACTAFRGAAEVGTVFTTLIAGRKPSVSVASPGTPYD